MQKATSTKLLVLKSSLFEFLEFQPVLGLRQLLIFGISSEGSDKNCSGVG